MAFNFDPTKYAQLVYRNHASTDFGIAVNDPWSPVHPNSDETKTHVTGRNGDLWQGNNAFNNVTETFTCTAIRDPKIYKTWFELEDAVNDWLQVGQGYDYLQFTTIPDWAFHAEAQPFTITPSANDDFQATVTLAFDCEPLMTSIRGMTWKAAPVDGAIINNTDIPVHPEWRITGKGDFALTINDETYYFDDVEDEITLNSDGNAWMKDADGALELCNDKIRLVNNDSPEFLCGKNTVQFNSVDTQGSVTVLSDPQNATCEYRALWKKVI